MFDPERDSHRGNGAFYRRVACIAVIAIGFCIILWPSITGFTSSSSIDQTCIAIRDGWRQKPDTSSAAAVLKTGPGILSSNSDAAARDAYAKKWRAWEAQPEVQDAFAAVDTASARAACIDPSRRRLLISGVGFATLGISLAAVVGVRRKRRRVAVSDV